jgi:hypothetical protein
MNAAQHALRNMQLMEYVDTLRKAAAASSNNKFRGVSRKTSYVQPTDVFYPADMEDIADVLEGLVKSPLGGS